MRVLALLMTTKKASAPRRKRYAASAWRPRTQATPPTANAASCTHKIAKRTRRARAFLPAVLVAQPFSRLDPNAKWHVLVQQPGDRVTPSEAIFDGRDKLALRADKGKSARAEQGEKRRESVGAGLCAPVFALRSLRSFVSLAPGLSRTLQSSGTAVARRSRHEPRGQRARAG